MTNIKRVVILGHSGFIGSHIERSLEGFQDVEVVGKSLPNIDLSDAVSASKLAEYFDESTAVIFLAAVKRQFGDTLEVYNKNMAIIENVCNLITANPVKRMIFLSSAAVYGEETENTRITELSPINPTSFYGIAKYTAERLLKKTCIDNQLTSLVCLRPPLIYGPGDEGRTYGPAGFVATACEGKDITLWGDGSELREFIYIDDVCSIVKELLNNDFCGELNVVSGEPYCFADIIDFLKKQFPHLIINSKPRSKDKADNAFIAIKIKDMLPVEFKFTSLESGLYKLIEKNR